MHHKKLLLGFLLSLATSSQNYSHTISVAISHFLCHLSKLIWLTQKSAQKNQAKRTPSSTTVGTIFSVSSSTSFLLLCTFSSSTSTVGSLGFSLAISISSVLFSRIFFLFCTLYNLSSYSTTVESLRFFSLVFLSSRSFFLLCTSSSSSTTV